MKNHKRGGRINVRFLIILGLVFSVGATGLVIAHTLRKRYIAQQALAAGKAAFEKKDWDTASRELRIYLNKNPKDVDVLMQFAQAQLSIYPPQPGTLGAAIAAYKKVLREQPENKDIAERLMRLNFAIGDFAETAYQAGQRRKVDPGDASATLWLGRALFAQRKYDKIISDSGDLVTFIEGKGSSAVKVYALISDAYAMSSISNPLDKAMETLKKAVDANPTSAEAFVRRANLYLVMASKAPGTPLKDKYRKAALDDLKKADQLNPSETDIRLLMAENWIVLNDRAKAQAELDAAKALPPDPALIFDYEREDAKLRLLITSAHLAAAKNDKEQMLAIANTGLKELTEGRRVQFLEVAAQLYAAAGEGQQAKDALAEYKKNREEMARSNKDVAERLALLDAQISATSKPYDALAGLQNAVTGTDVQNPLIWRELARGYLRTGQQRRAADAFEKYVVDKRDDVTALVDLAEIYYRVGDWAKALRNLDVAIEQNELLPTAEKVDILPLQLKRIECILRGGRGVPPTAQELQRFATDLQRMHQENEKRVEVRCVEAILALAQKSGEDPAAQQKRLDAAEDILRKAIKECSDPLPAMLQLGELLARRKKFDEAVAVCRDAIKQAPASSRPRALLASTLLAAGKKDEVSQALNEAAASLQGDELATIQMTLAGYMIASDQRDDGLNLLRKVSQGRPDDPQPRVQLVDALLDIPGRQKADAATLAEAQKLVDEIKKIEGERGIRWQYEQARVIMATDGWTKRQDDVISLLNRVVEGDRGSASAVLLLGGALESVGKDAPAEAVYKRFVENFPGNMLVTTRYLDLLDRQQRYEQAQQFLQQLPDLPELARYRTNIDIRQGRYEDAIQELLKQKKNNPNDAAIQVLLARLTYQNTHDLAKSLAMLDEAQKLAPDLLSVYSTRIVLLHADGKNDQAHKELDNLVQQRNDFSAYLLRADYYAQEHLFDEAEKDYQHLTTMAGSAAEGNLRLGMFYERIGKPDKAAAAYEAGVKADADNRPLKRNLAHALLSSSNADSRAKGKALLAQLLSATPKDPTLIMIQAESYLREGNAESREKAMSLYESVVQADSRLIEAHLQLIRLASEQGDLANASQLAARAIGANPENNDLVLVSAGVEADGGNYGRARELANTVLQRDAANISAKNLMTDVALHLKELDEAEKQNKEVLQRDPNQEGARLSQARILELRKKIPEAIKNLEEFRNVPAGKDSYRVALALGDLYRQQKEFAKSEAMLQEVDKSAPDLYGAFTIRLQSLAAQAKYDELLDMVNKRLDARPSEAQTLVAGAAILGEGNATAQLNALKPRLQKFIAANPSSIPAHLALAMLSYRTGDIKGAQQSYEAALKLDPYNATALNDLAWILSEEMGDYPTALGYASKGVLRYESNPNLRNTRGVIFFRMKDLGKARLDLQRCIELPSVLPSTRAKSLVLLSRIDDSEGDTRQARARAEQARQIDREASVLSPQERADLDKLLGVPATRASAQ